MSWLPDHAEVVHLELLDVLFPELFRVAWSPVQLVSVDFFGVFLIGREDSVVLLEDVNQEFEVVFKDLVLDVLSEFVVNDLEQVVVNQELDALLPLGKVLVN